MRLHALSVALLLALTTPFGAVVELGGEKASAALERALGAIDAQKIESDLTFIASDELKGRDTPSAGLRIAARFIRARLARLGFTPGGDDGFYDRYSMTKVGVDMETTAMFLEKKSGTTQLGFGEGYYFRSGEFVTHDLKGAVLFVGTGTAEELANVDLRGHWALLFDSQSSERDRQLRFVAAGAIGQIVMAPEGQAKALDRGARWSRRSARYGTLRVDETVFPSLRLTEDGAEELLDGSRLTLGQKLPLTVRDLRRTSGDAETVPLENVAGLWPGSDPKLKHEVIVISAHYDHVGTKGDKIYNGADDNGSGTVGLMALAEALVEYGPLRRSVLLLWVSGEEKGLKGSYAWTIDPTLADGYRAVCNLNIDMIGRNASDSLLITPSKAHPAYNDLVKMAERNAPTEGFPKLESCDEYWRRSDHKNFSDVLKIPVAFLFAGVHEDYHKPTDTIEKIDYDKVRRVTRLLMRMLNDLQADELL